MRYSVAELAKASGVSVDTVRYYQARGLLPPPGREGRRAVYGEDHRERLARIRALAARGLSLRAIGSLLAGERAEPADQALLAALEEAAPEPRYTLAELASELGVPEGLVGSIEKAGIIEAQAAADGSGRYSEADLRVIRGALGLLQHGFPITRLLALAVRHDRAIRRTIDAAIDLFDDYVRRRESGSEADPDAVVRAYRELLPVATSLVAHHFQRTLVNRALERLRRSGERELLEAAVEAASSARLRVEWK